MQETAATWVDGGGKKESKKESKQAKKHNYDDTRKIWATGYGRQGHEQQQRRRFGSVLLLGRACRGVSRDFVIENVVFNELQYVVLHRLMAFVCVTVCVNVFSVPLH